MKIMIISDLTGGPGGVYKYLQQVETFTSSKTRTCIVLDLITQDYVNQYYSFKSVYFVPLSYKFHSKNTIIKTLKDILKEHKPDIVHVVNGSIKSNLVIRKFLIDNRVLFIVTEQFIDSSLKLEKNTLEQIKSINSKTNHVIYVSENNKKIVNNQFQIECKNNSVIYNGILPIKYKKICFSKQPFRFFTIARCAPQKGLDTVIRALAKVLTKKACFHVIGDGEYATEYINFADTLLGQRHEFKVLGWNKNIDYRLIAKNYDLFISASRQEGLSFSVLEMATLGMPMICSDASGNKELIKLCDRGALFDVGNVDQLTKQISNFLINPSNLNEKSIAGSKKIDNIFNIKKTIKQLEAVYAKL